MNKILLLLVSAFISQNALANAKVIGNGGDFFTLYPETIWFDKVSGKSSITACVQSSKDFAKNIDNSQIKRTILSAYEQWVEYLSLKGNVFIRYRLNESFEDWIVKKYSEALVPKISFSSNCKGNEDLTFLLGISNKKVEAAKKRFQNPLAFAILEDFNFSNRWGKGFIWIGSEGSLFPNIKFPEWDQDSLKAAILHELGHVFGQPHVDQTIMTESFVDFLMHTGHWGARSVQGFENDRDLKTFYFNNIDHQRTLIPCLECIPKNIDGIVSEYNFTRLTEERASGKISAKIVPNNVLKGEFKFLLIIADSLKEHIFQINLDPAPSRIISGQDMIVLSGSLVDRNGKAKPVRFLYNEMSVYAGHSDLGKIFGGISLELLEYEERFNFHRYQTIFFSLKDYR